MAERKSWFNYEELLSCGRGELFGLGNAQLPLPPLLMFDRITHVSETGGEHGKGEIKAEFDITPDGRRTVLTLVATDRPGLLSDVAQVLRAQKINVHDARIATFGERAEDLFQVTDEDAQPLGDAVRQQTLREALHAACFEHVP